MRNNDPEPTLQRPLGERVTKQTPSSQPTWRPKPDAPGIEISSDGKVRTNLPLPKG